MSGPGDEPAAGEDRSRLRASHADREHVIDVLKAGFVQGRLTKDELDARVARTLTSRTCAELAEVTADIPAGLAGAQPPRKPARARARPPAHILVINATTTVLTAGLWAAAVVTHADGGPIFMLVFISAFAWIGFLIMSGLLMLESRNENRSRGPRPGPPESSAGGKGCQRTASDAQAEQLPQSSHAPRHTAEAARSHLPHPQLSWDC